MLSRSRISSKSFWACSTEVSALALTAGASQRNFAESASVATGPRRLFLRAAGEPHYHEAGHVSTRGTLYLVSTPIGNLADLSARAVEVLRSSDVVFAEDTRRTRILLDHYGISTRDLRSYHKHNEAARCEEAKEILEAGKSLALVSDSGTPLISDPGGRLVRTAIDRKATVVPVPGASAALAALVASGLDTSTFTFLGFVPKSGRERRSYIDSLKTMLRTAVLFESPQRLVDTLAELGGELGDDRAVVVGRELTKVHEEFFRGTLSEALAYYKEHAPRGEIVICLAAAAKAGAAENVEAARSLALEMAQGGSTSREIVRALRDRFGLERNRAYALALEAAEEGEE